LATWHKSVTTEVALNVTTGGFPFNTRATPVFAAIPGLPPTVNFVMAIDYGRLAVHHNTTGRDLSRGWEMLGPKYNENHAGFFACPSIHWEEADGYFYAISGGRRIDLARSRDLKMWEKSTVASSSSSSSGNGNGNSSNANDGGAAFIAADPAADGKLSPYMGLRAQAAAQGRNNGEGVIDSDLSHPTCWDHNSNDADFCCSTGPLSGGGAPTDVAWVFYSASSQGRPADPNCSRVRPGLGALNFNNIATVRNVSLGTLLASYF
jgi:hypothetical protein